MGILSFIGQQHLSSGYVLFCWQKRTRKPPAISTRWTHEKGAARPFQTPKEKSKRKKASRFAKRFFLVSPFYGFADGVTSLINFTSSKEAMLLYFFVSDFIRPPSAMIFWMNGGKGSA